MEESNIVSLLHYGGRNDNYHVEQTANRNIRHDSLLKLLFVTKRGGDI